MKKELSYGLIGLATIVSPIVKENINSWMLPEQKNPSIEVLDATTIEINHYLPRAHLLATPLQWYDRVIDTYHHNGLTFEITERKIITYHYDLGLDSYSVDQVHFDQGQSRSLTDLFPEIDLPDSTVRRSIGDDEV